MISSFLCEHWLLSLLFALALYNWLLYPCILAKRKHFSPSSVMLLTGGAQGLGKHIVLEFATKHARDLTIVIFDI